MIPPGTRSREDGPDGGGGLAPGGPIPGGGMSRLPPRTEAFKAPGGACIATDDKGAVVDDDDADVECVGGRDGGGAATAVVRIL